MCKFGRLNVIIGACLLAMQSPAQAADDSWVRSWAAAPSDEAVSVATVNPFPFEDMTFRTIIRLSAGGNRVRLRLSNELSEKPLTINAVRIALSRDGVLVPGSERTVSFGGSGATTIPGHSPAVSDAVDMVVDPLSDLIVSLHIKGPSRTVTAHMLGHSNTELFYGDQTAVAAPKDGTPSFMRYIVSGVDVEAKGSNPATAVAFGDSITDGAASTFGANHRWPDLLSARFAKAGVAVGVANLGISGNQLLRPGFGAAALSRLDRDAFSAPNLRYIVLLEGINDIGMAVTEGRPVPTAEELIGAYRQIIARAHEHKVLIFGATLLPFAGTAPNYYSDQGEKVRRAVNEWIRTSKAFDGVIDFAAAVADAKDPNQMATQYDSGDHLHPSDAGYTAMADAIDLKLFRIATRDK